MGPMNIVDLKMERLAREQDNTKVSVEDLLMLALKDVKKMKTSRAILCIVEDRDDGDFSLNGYRCGLNTQEELGFMEAFKMQVYNLWSKT